MGQCKTVPSFIRMEKIAKSMEEEVDSFVATGHYHKNMKNMIMSFLDYGNESVLLCGRRRSFKTTSISIAAVIWCKHFENTSVVIYTHGRRAMGSMMNLLLKLPNIPSEPPETGYFRITLSNNSTIFVEDLYGTTLESHVPMSQICRFFVDEIFFAKKKHLENLSVIIGNQDHKLAMISSRNNTLSAHIDSEFTGWKDFGCALYLLNGTSLKDIISIVETQVSKEQYFLANGFVQED
jgi:hypothetical protein